MSSSVYVGGFWCKIIFVVPSYETKPEILTKIVAKKKKIKHLNAIRFIICSVLLDNGNMFFSFIISYQSAINICCHLMPDKTKTKK